MDLQSDPTSRHRIKIDSSSSPAPKSAPSPSRPPDHWLADEPGVRKKVEGIVAQLHAPPHMREDLLQEGLCHLCEQELAKPGQKESWYLQNCLFHLWNYLRRGRSIDSWKHHINQSPNNARPDSSDEMEMARGLDDSLFSTVAADDTKELLATALHGRARVVFLDLTKGLKVNEIARQHHWPHQKVSKCLVTIVLTARKIGIERFST